MITTFVMHRHVCLQQQQQQQQQNKTYSCAFTDSVAWTTDTLTHKNHFMFPTEL